MTLDVRGDLMGVEREWNEMARTGGFYSSTHWLSQSGVAATRYVVARDGERMTGGLPITFEPAHGVALPRYTDICWMFGDEPPSPAVIAQLYPYISCGVVRGYTNRNLLADAPGSPERGHAQRTLIDGARAEARHLGAKFVAYTYVRTDDALELIAAAPELVPVYAESESAIDRIADFDGNLRMMSRKRQWVVRREQARFAECGLRIEIRPLADVYRSLAALVAGHEQKFGGSTSIDEVESDYVRWLAAGLGELTRVYCAYRDATMVGGILFIKYGDTLYGRDLGISPEVPRDAAAYFNLVFYAPVRASEPGVVSIHYGIGSHEAKINRGCHVRPQWYVLDPIEPLGAALRSQLAAGGRARLAGEMKIAGKHHTDASIATMFELVDADRLFAHGS